MKLVIKKLIALTIHDLHLDWFDFLHSSFPHVNLIFVFWNMTSDWSSCSLLWYKFKTLMSWVLTFWIGLSGYIKPAVITLSKKSILMAVPSHLTPHKLDVVLSGSLLSAMVGFLTSEAEVCSILRDMPAGMLPSSRFHLLIMGMR